MRMIPVQEGLQRLFRRQESLPELQLHANGHCAHLGKLSPGCLKCFVADGFYRNICPAYLLDQPTDCQANCAYCLDNLEARRPEHLPRPDLDAWQEARAEELSQKLVERHPTAIIPALSFSGGGDPTAFFEVVVWHLELLGRIEKQLPSIPWYYMYTNGIEFSEDRIKQCRDLGLDEVRFHLGASNFSERVYRHLELAAKHLRTVSVETPAWPPHRKKLFEMLPRIHDLGVQHLNLGQVEINSFNIARIAQAYPEAEFYQVLSYQLDDGGLVYDIMREVLARKYAYSVLDCNGLVKAIQRASEGGILTRQVAYDGTDLAGLVDFEKWQLKQAGH